MITLRAPHDVDELLTLAERATGESRTHLVIEAIRTSLPEVVKRIDQERANQMRKFAEKTEPSSASVSDVAATLRKKAVASVENLSPKSKH